MVVYSVFYNHDSEETPYYILDGHHKLLAYQQLRINAPVVFISRTENTRAPFKNILPQLLDVLKTCEIMHVLQEDDNIADVTVYMQSAMVHYLDKLLKEKKSVDLNIITMLYNAYHSNDEGISEWAKQRFAVLSTNNYQGKGQRLRYKSKDPKVNYMTWRTIFIENLTDFYAWKKVLLENGDMPAKIIEKQHRLQERYYPRPKPPEPTPFPRSASYEGSARTYPDSNVFRILGRILLAALALISITKGCR